MIKAKPLLPFVSHGCKGFLICFDENFKISIIRYGDAPLVKG